MNQKPNIILFINEQHRGDCLSIEDHPVLLTPNMDNIAGLGARFTRAYSDCPTCIAARRSILSGQFPATHGMRGFQDGVEWNITETLATSLAQAGYETAWIGRGMHQCPVENTFGFEHVLLQASGRPSDYTDFLQKQRPDDWEGSYGTGVMHNDWTARPWHLDEDLHPTNWTVHEALRFLRDRDQTKPFFLVVSFLAAHPPLTPPAFYFDRYIRTGVPDPMIGDWAQKPANGGKGLDVGAQQVDLKGEALLSARAGYYGLINHLDDQIRRLLSPISGINSRRPGMTNGNTVVAMTSDHGEMLGDHYLWHKIMPYEPAARIPLLIHAPERFGIQAGTVIDEAVTLADVMPTLLDIAGVDIPDGVEGKSLLPLMLGKKQTVRLYIHIEHSPHYQCLTDGKKKYIWFVADGREQFFDLVEDPSECHNLAGLPEMSASLSYWRKQLVEKLKDRPEGFSDGVDLIPGKEYPATLPTSAVVEKKNTPEC